MSKNSYIANKLWLVQYLICLHTWKEISDSFQCEKCGITVMPDQHKDLDTVVIERLIKIDREMIKAHESFI